MRWLITILVALALSAAAADEPSKEAIGASSRPLAIYVDGVSRWETQHAKFLGQPTYVQGDLRGWRLYGWMVPHGDRPRVRRITATAADGSGLRLERPDPRFEGREPVLSIAPDGSLLFTMAPSLVKDRRRDGGPKTPRTPPAFAADRLAVAGVREVRIERDPAAPPAPGQSGNAEPGAFELVVGERRERITTDALRAVVPGSTGGPFTRWSLDALVAAKVAASVAEVRVSGRRTTTIDGKALGEAKGPYLRLNKRGFFKLEGETVAPVPDVSRIEVVLEEE